MGQRGQGTMPRTQGEEVQGAGRAISAMDSGRKAGGGGLWLGGGRGGEVMKKGVIAGVIQVITW